MICEICGSKKIESVNGNWSCIKCLEQALSQKMYNEIDLTTRKLEFHLVGRHRVKEQARYVYISSLDGKLESGTWNLLYSPDELRKQGYEVTL